MKARIYVTALVVLLVTACKKDKDISADDFSTTSYEMTIPAGFPPMVIPADNPLTVEGIELGHHLFFDPIMSVNGFELFFLS